MSYLDLKLTLAPSLLQALFNQATVSPNGMQNILPNF